MVKSKPSATGAAMVRTSAGSYPKSMESLLEANGHVPLDPEKYEGYTEDEVNAFFASRDYEVSWFTNEDGKLWFIASDFAEGSVENNDKNNLPQSMVWNLIRSGGLENGGSRIVHHHNHPVLADDGNGYVDIFSRDDLYYYAEMAGKYPKTGKGLPYFTVFKVHTKQGDTFSIRGNTSVTELRNMADDYASTYQYAASLARKRANSGAIPHTNRACADFITQFMVDHMTASASWYGVDFDTNWKKRNF